MKLLSHLLCIYEFAMNVHYNHRNTGATADATTDTYRPQKALTTSTYQPFYAHFQYVFCHSG